MSKTFWTPSYFYPTTLPVISTSPPCHLDRSGEISAYSFVKE